MIVMGALELYVSICPPIRSAVASRSTWADLVYDDYGVWDTFSGCIFTWIRLFFFEACVY